MTKFDEMLELEEKMNNAAIDCSVRIRNKYNDPYPDVRVGDMLRASFLEGIKWLARELKKEQVENEHI